MKRLLAYAIAVVAGGAITNVLSQAPDPAATNPDLLYHIGPDSLAQDGVPKGEMRGPFTLPSRAYPGTQHTYWIYVPAQYSGSAPASLMIFQDGQAFKNPDGNLRAHYVMDRSYGYL